MGLVAAERMSGSNDMGLMWLDMEFLKKGKSNEQLSWRLKKFNLRHKGFKDEEKLKNMDKKTDMDYVSLQ